jgi:O-antigen ligase
MIKASVGGPGARTEAALLMALAFVLPLWEAPKNLVAVAFVLTWFVNRARARDFGGPWDRWDTLIAVWIGSGFAVAAFAGIHLQEWRGALDIVRYGLVLWCLKRSRPGDATLVSVVVVTVVATAIGLGWGYWKWMVEPRRQFIELHSVGHVNHSAIYLAIVLGACTSLVLAKWPRLGTGMRLAGIVIVGFLLAFLVALESRAALGVGLLLLVILGVAWWPRTRVFAGAAALAAVAVVAVLAVYQPVIVTKHLRNVETDNVLSFRDQIWQTSLSALREHPLFGVGIDNFSSIDEARVRTWAQARGETFDESRFFFAPHGHSLLFNTLAERGLVGSAVLALVLFAWLWSLARGYPGVRGTDADWIAWGGALSAWIVTAGVGLANTTLHHEHGLLATMLLGLWLARRRPRT